MKVQKNDNISIYDRLSVQLALALKKQDDPGVCLTPDDFNNWVEGKLTKKQENAMWIHIDACPLCYDEWMALPAPAQKQQFSTTLSNFLSDISYIIQDFMRSLLIPRYGIPAFAVVMSCLLIVYIQLFRVSTLETNLNNSFQLAIENNEQTSFQMPWEEQQHKALIGPDSISFAKKAFATGLIDGRNQLLNQASISLFSEKDHQKMLNNGKLQLFYHTGKWMALLQSLKINEKKYADPFWSDQKQILDQFLQRISLLESTPDIQDLLEKLTQINGLWGEKNNYVQMRWQNRLNNKFKNLIAFFSPKQIKEK